MVIDCSNEKCLYHDFDAKELPPHCPRCGDAMEIINMTLIYVTYSLYPQADEPETHVYEAGQDLPNWAESVRTLMRPNNRGVVWVGGYRVTRHVEVRDFVVYTLFSHDESAIGNMAHAIWHVTGEKPAICLRDSGVVEMY